MPCGHSIPTVTTRSGWAGAGLDVTRASGEARAVAAVRSSSSVRVRDTAWTLARCSVEREQGALDRLRVEIAANEDDPRAAIVVRPRVEVLRRMDDVLHAVEEQRPSAADVE